MFYQTARRPPKGPKMPFSLVTLTFPKCVHRFRNHNNRRRRRLLRHKAAQNINNVTQNNTIVYLLPMFRKKKIRPQRLEFSY